MAKNSPSSNPRSRPSSPRGNAHRFIEYALSPNDKEILRTEYSESDFGYDLVEDLVSQGYKFSLTYSDSVKSFICTVTDRREDSQFHNVSLSGRGSTIANARISLLYRHFVVAQTDWNILDSGGTKGGEDFG